MSIKEAFLKAAKLSVKAYTEFSGILYNLGRIGEAENRLASVSRYGYSFVSAFSEYKDLDFTDTYISIIEQATEMCVAGVDEARILYFFENKKRGAE